MLPASRRLLAVGLLLLPVLGALGCLKRPVKEDVYRKNRIEIFLRSEKRLFSTVERDFDQPVVIAPVRLAHILSRIDVRLGAGEGGKRLPAIPTEMLFPIASGLNQALAKAGPDQEVVVMAVRRFRRFAVFDRDYLTSFLCYVRGDTLYVHLSRTEWEIPTRRKERLPEPHIGDHPMRFKVFSGQAMSLVDKQSVAVTWRDPVFERPTRTRVLPTGEVLRREILMESSPDEIQQRRSQEPLPTDLSPDQLRELADLEEARRQGGITETEYHARRQAILSP
jgi:hypothetical protein